MLAMLMLFTYDGSVIQNKQTLSLLSNKNMIIQFDSSMWNVLMFYYKTYR